MTTSFGSRIDDLDLGLFGHIASQTTPNDRRSLLAIHSSMRRPAGRPFGYLEIGSHLGGSLQPFVVDPQCAAITSIDPRPMDFRDQRGLVISYPENSSARMLQLLNQIPEANTGKIQVIEKVTSEMDPSMVAVRPDYCFIDGEHTDTAVLCDARFCLRVVNPDGCLVFHDAQIIYRGLEAFLNELTAAHLSFRAYVLADSIFLIELGSCRLADEEPIRSLLKNNYQAYLFGLRSYEWYREVLNRPLFLRLRRTRFIRRFFVVPGLREQGV